MLPAWFAGGGLLLMSCGGQWACSGSIYY